MPAELNPAPPVRRSLTGDFIAARIAHPRQLLVRRRRIPAPRRTAALVAERDDRRARIATASTVNRTVSLPGRSAPAGRRDTADQGNLPRPRTTARYSRREARARRARSPRDAPPSQPADSDARALLAA